MQSSNLSYVLGIATVGLSIAAHGAPVTLPGPTESFDGLPVTTQYGDFHSYSGGLLEQWGYLSPADYAGPGRDALDVTIGTTATDTDNLTSGPSGDFSFESPIQFEANSSADFEGGWGRGQQNHGPVPVDDVVAYLQAVNPGNGVPAFAFEHERPDLDSVLAIKAEAYVWDPARESKVASWSLDSGANNPVFISPVILVTGASGTSYFADNRDADKLDFILRAPAMDLGQYTGEGYWFVKDLSVQGTAPDYAEWRLSGLYGNATSISEPPLLLPLGLLALFGIWALHLPGSLTKAGLA